MCLDSVMNISIDTFIFAWLLVKYVEIDFVVLAILMSREGSLVLVDIDN